MVFNGKHSKIYRITGKKRVMNLENKNGKNKKSKKSEDQRSIFAENYRRRGSDIRSRSASPQSHSTNSHSTDKNTKDVVKKIRVVLKATKFMTDRGIDNRLALSMSGCGFLGSYHFGVVICFQKNAKFLLSRITHFGGSSVGSLLAALATLAPDSLKDALKELYNLADEINSYSLGALAPGFYMAQRLSTLVDKFLPSDVSAANGRLFVSVTKQSNYKNHLISVFPSRSFLIKSLNASCYIPIYSMGYFANPPEIDGDKCIDGGYSNNLPVFENIPTITVSPFSGSAIISPSDRNLFDWNMRLGNQLMKVNLQNVVRGAQALFPPSTTVLRTYYELGYRHAMKFLLDNDFLERNGGTEL